MHFGRMVCSACHQKRHFRVLPLPSWCAYPCNLFSARQKKPFLCFQHPVQICSRRKASSGTSHSSKKAIGNTEVYEQHSQVISFPSHLIPKQILAIRGSLLINLMPAAVGTHFLEANRVFKCCCSLQ